MTWQGEHHLDGDIVLRPRIEISSTDLAQALANDPQAVRILAEVVRKSQVRQARGKGNAFGNWAQTRPKPKAVQPNTVQRIF